LARRKKGRLSPATKNYSKKEKKKGKKKIFKK